MINSSISDNASNTESVTLKYNGNRTPKSSTDRQKGGEILLQNDDCPLTSEEFLRARQKFLILENANCTKDRYALAEKDANKNKSSSKPVEANKNLPQKFTETSNSTTDTEHEIKPPFQSVLNEGSTSTVSPADFKDFKLQEKLIYKTKTPIMLPNAKPCCSVECSGTTNIQEEFDFHKIRNKFNNRMELNTGKVKRLIDKLERKTKTSEHDGKDQVKRRKECGKMIYKENNTESRETEDNINDLKNHNLKTSKTAVSEDLLDTCFNTATKPKEYPTCANKPKSIRKQY